MMKRPAITGALLLSSVFLLTGARIERRNAPAEETPRSSGPTMGTGSGGDEGGGRRIRPAGGGGPTGDRSGVDQTAPRPSSGERPSGGASDSRRIQPREGVDRTFNGGGTRGSAPSERPSVGYAGPNNRIRRGDGTSAPDHRAAIIRDPSGRREIERRQRYENSPRRYYWHRYNGSRYCHYYDAGIHWYGFYIGPSFYWTRYHGGRWWWHDAHYGRWVYYENDRWWWPGPDRVVYVYSDDGYRPAGDLDSVPASPASASQPDEPTKDAGGSWNSPDERRMVQVYGERREAFLYDTTAKAPVFMTFLGSGVEKVRFSGGKDGKPLRLLLDYSDGTFKFFSDDGDELDDLAQGEERRAPEPPKTVSPPPPPPNSAP